jgi:hypothetical protein
VLRGQQQQQEAQQCPATLSEGEPHTLMVLKDIRLAQQCAACMANLPWLVCAPLSEWDRLRVQQTVPPPPLPPTHPPTPHPPTPHPPTQGGAHRAGGGGRAVAAADAQLVPRPGGSRSSRRPPTAGVPGCPRSWTTAAAAAAAAIGCHGCVWQPPQQQAAAGVCHSGGAPSGGASSRV